jgi:hypothetical protein
MSMAMRARQSLQKTLLQAQMHGEDMPGFHVYSVVKKPDPNNPQAFIRVHEQVSFKTLKELKQPCTMYGPTVSFTAQMLQNAVGNSALLPEYWMGIAKACLSPGEELLWKTSSTELCAGQEARNAALGIPITLAMLLGKGPLEGVFNQLQCLDQQIAIAAT